MPLRRLWLFVVVAVLLAEAVFCKQVSGVGSSLAGGQELAQKLPNHSIGTPVQQGALDEPSNQSELTGNWTSPIDGMRYSNASSKIGSHLSSLPQERSEDVFKKMVGGSFSKKLFAIALRLRIPEKALNTRFIQGMKSGILRPEVYGRYMVQDAVYLANLAELFQGAARELEEQSPDNIDLALSFTERSTRYESDFKQTLKTWQLKGAECVETGPAVRGYMEYQRGVMIRNPKNLLIGTLPCSMLWPWMAGNLMGEVNPQNPYKPWFVTNVREPGKQGTTEILVDANFTAEDEEESLLIFCMGLIMEANFFREAGGEGLFMSPEKICKELISSLKM